jgi:hypothetical protein
LPRKKPILQHVTFGDCKVLDAFYTASSGSAFFKVETEAGITKQLLAEKQYWLSDPAKLRTVFDSFSAKALLAEKQKRAAERKKDVYAVSKTLSHDRRVRALSKIDKDVEEIECGTGIDNAEQEHRSDEQAYAAGEW